MCLFIIFHNGHLSEASLIPNILKWQERKIFSKLVPSQTPSRTSHRRCSVKKGVLKTLQNFTGKHLRWSLFLSFRCFLVKFVKFLRTPILKNICEWLLLQILDIILYFKDFWQQNSTKIVAFLFLWKHSWCKFKRNPR